MHVVSKKAYNLKHDFSLEVCGIVESGAKNAQEIDENQCTGPRAIVECEAGNVGCKSNCIGVWI